MAGSWEDGNERLGSIKTVTLLTARRLSPFVIGLFLIDLLLSLILDVSDHEIRIFLNIQKPFLRSYDRAS